MNFRLRAVLFFVLWTPVIAQNPNKISVISEVLLKILSENRTWNLSLQDSFRMVIVYDSSDAISKSEASSFRRVFVESFRTPADKPIAVRMISDTKFDKISWQGRNAAFFTRGEFTYLGSILNYCEEARVLTISSDTSLVAKGIAIAVDVGKDKYPEIWFNVNALKNEGAEFRKEILQLAKHLAW